MPGFPVLHCLPEFAQIHAYLSQGCYLTISSFATLFYFCLQSFLLQTLILSATSPFLKLPKRMGDC